MSVFRSTLTPIYPLKIVEIKNSQLAIQTIKNQNPISNFNENYNYFLLFLDFFRVWFGNWLRAKDQEVTAEDIELYAKSFEKNSLTKLNILEARLAVTEEFVFLLALIDSKGKILKAIEKKILISCQQL